MRSVNDINVHDLLPQRKLFVMLDSMHRSDSKVTVTSLTVRFDNFFCEDGKLCEAGLLENMAQTCAARMGYISLELEGGCVKLGFIGSIRNMNILRLPKIGEKIITEATVLEEVFGMTLMHLKITASTGDTIAEGEMKISLTDIPAA
ncbi:MAG: pseudouridylate synthase [Tannerellaceae bacterium]|jgi:predicted hotdog family 3-hydroxylacyl-ACP dehydratase|nr:pseudouridylate synthase [Tannerellaceae bacterium]